MTAEAQKPGRYPPDIAPPPATTEPVTPDRREAYKRYQAALSPDEYLKQVVKR